MTTILRPYQARAESPIRSALREHQRVIVVGPTGSGKGKMISWLAAGASAKGKRVLIVVHRRELVEQTIAALAEEGSTPGVIAAGYTEVPNLSSQVAMVMSVTQPQRLQRWAGWQPDLLIVDECHHLIARSWQQLIEVFPSSYMVGFTATPLRFDGKGLGRIFGDMIVVATTKELIGDGYLSPVQHFVPPEVPDFSTVTLRGGEYSADEAASVMRNVTIYGDAVEHYERLFAGGAAIGYATTIKHSKELAEYFTDRGQPAAHVDSATATRDREAALASLAKGSLKVIFNVGLFTEGLDIPALAGVLLLRPTNSLGLYLQMCGRALRTARGKTVAVIADHAGNCYRHGLVDEDDTWSLRDRAEKTDAPPPAAAVKRCDRCGAVMPKAAGTCPACGQAQLRLVAPAETVAGELVAADPVAVLRERLRNMPGPRQIVWAAGDEARLRLVGEIRGYARPNGWAWHMAREHAAGASR
jgi:DNA repair protein RadD